MTSSNKDSRSDHPGALNKLILWFKKLVTKIRPKEIAKKLFALRKPILCTL